MIESCTYRVHSSRERPVTGLNIELNKKIFFILLMCYGTPLREWPRPLPAPVRIHHRTIKSSTAITCARKLAIVMHNK